MASTRARPSLTRVLLGVNLATFLIFTAALLVPGAAHWWPWNVIVTTGALWLPAAIFWVVVVRTRGRRVDVLLATLAVTSFAIGSTFFSAEMDADGRLPFPSLADVGYLAFYPLMLAAIVVIIRRQRQGVPWWVVLESVVAALGTAAVLTAALDPILSEIANVRTSLAAAVTVAYPIVDVLLIAIMVGVAASPSLEVGTRWLWLVGGLLLVTVGDVSFAVLETCDYYFAGTLVDATWPLGFLLMAVWATGQEGEPARTSTGRRFASPVPAIGVVAGIGVLVVASLVHVSLPAVILAGATVGLAALPVMLRQTALRRLLASQEEVVRQFEELDRSKSELMSTVNHELRTPLTSILGYVELLRDGEGGHLPTAADDMLAVVAHNAERLEQLVDDMLTLSVLDSEPSPASRGPVELSPVVERVIVSLEPFATTRGVDLSVEWNASTCVLEGDSRQLERALRKVTHNAIKFTPAGGSVGIEIEQQPTLVVVRVIDTGIGIPEKDLPLLFGRFFRASNAHAGAVPGTGLGLAIVRSLIRAHGGEISVTSAEHIGTTVRIELPLPVAP